MSYSFEGSFFPSIEFIEVPLFKFMDSKGYGFIKLTTFLYDDPRSSYSRDEFREFITNSRAEWTPFRQRKTIFFTVDTIVYFTKHNKIYELPLEFRVISGYTERRKSILYVLIKYRKLTRRNMKVALDNLKENGELGPGDLYFIADYE